LADLNFVALTGFSTRDPTLRQKSSGQIKAEFSFEVDRPFLRANGKPVSDLVLVDAWQELGEWVMENVHTNTRLLLIGTLNKESYTSHGTREHMTIVKAKYIRLSDGYPLEEEADLEELKKDRWDKGLLLSAVQLIEDALQEVAGEEVAGEEDAGEEDAGEEDAGEEDAGEEVAGSPAGIAADS
jgi:hypothetical protein